jgi:16S rRNA (cytosine967-C5)-methyltransferase
LVPTALRLVAGDPARIAAVQDGRMGVQDEGSQAVALALAAVPIEGPDKRWLDLCAGPGGKAALLAALAAQRGATLFANEVSEHRAELVRQSLKAIPPEAIEAIRVGDGRDLGELEPGGFDRVMVDAPCSGLGALRRRPESRWRRQPTDVAQLRPLQVELLESALKAVRVGGVVAYVTCSPHLAETTVVVDDALRALAKNATGQQYERLDASAALRDVVLPEARDKIEQNRSDSAAQLWPHIHGSDAMFLALIKRVE